MVTVNYYQRITVSESFQVGALFVNVESRARKSIRVWDFLLYIDVQSSSNMNVNISLIEI